MIKRYEKDLYVINKQELTMLMEAYIHLNALDIVLYQENLDFEVLANARREIAKADMLIVAGTSLSVYPAAGLLDAFFGKYLVVINKDMPKKDLHVKLYIDKPVGEVLDKIKV